MKVSRDAAALGSSLVLYSLSLGISNVALPLLALDAGYGVAAVGGLTAVSAVAQFMMRMTIGAASRRYSDRALVGFAASLLAASGLVVSVSPAVVPFIAAELLQGASRGYFWTGSQLHVLRLNSSSLRGIAAVNGASSIGLIAGPLIAGLLAQHSAPGMAVAAAAAALAVLPTLAMEYVAPVGRQRESRLRGAWRTRSALAGYWASATGGAWSGLLNSYAPVVLARAGQSSSTIGVIISCANTANILGSVAVGRLPRRHVTIGYVACTATAGLGTVLIGLVAEMAPLTSVALVLSGFGAGTLLTLGPALATDGVRPESRPDALVAAGTFRAAALFASPLGIAMLSHALPLGLAVAMLGVPMLLTALNRPGPGSKLDA